MEIQIRSFFYSYASKKAPMHGMTVRGGRRPLLFHPRIERGIVSVEILGIQVVLGDAEGIGEFSVSNEPPKCMNMERLLTF